MVKIWVRWFWLAGVVVQSCTSQTKAQTRVSTECIDGTLFTLVSGDGSNFNSAVSKCADLDPTNDSVLAAIRNVDHFNAAVALAGSTGSSWIGLVDNEEGNSNTDRFRYISSDQTGLSEFVNVGTSKFPWGDTQPNSLEQKCVSLFALNNEGVLFNDDTCTDQRRYICSSKCVLPTSAPILLTSAPTSPTLAPTTPTAAPTLPTLAPTSPTSAPTPPTSAPTPPTSAPTPPTSAPTPPTSAPTPPTSAPTSAPTPPTSAPTPPTSAPTPPTAAPTPPTPPPPTPSPPTPSPPTPSPPTPSPPTSSPPTPSPPTPFPTTRSPPSPETTGAPTKTSDDAAAINIGVIIGILLPILALASLFSFMVLRRDDLRKRFGKSKEAPDDASTFKKELLTQSWNNNTIGLTEGGEPEFSLEQFVKPGKTPNFGASKKSTAPLIPVANVVDTHSSQLDFLASKKKKSESTSKSLTPRPALSSATLVRKQKEKADEDEFEALLANNGKKSTSVSGKTKDEEEFDALIANKGKKPSLKVSKADEAEFEAILSGATKKKSSISGRKAVSNNPGFKKKAPVPPPASNEARPQSTYLASADENKNRKSIFRPSSIFLSKAKRDKATRKQKEELKKHYTVSKQKFDIDSDI